VIKRLKLPVDTLSNSDQNKKKEEILKLTQQKKPNLAARNARKTKTYNLGTYGEAKPVDERKFGRVKPRTTTRVNKGLTGPWPDRNHPGSKPLTPAELEFLRKQKELGGKGKSKGGSGKTKPVMPRRGGR